MSVYVYTLKATTRKLLVGGNAQPANLFEFAFKPGPTWSRRLEARREQMIDHGCNEHDKARGCSISNTEVWAVLYGFCEDSPVFRNVTSGVWVDGDAFPGEYVGTLAKVSGRWHVVPCMIGNDPGYK